MKNITNKISIIIRFLFLVFINSIGVYILAGFLPGVKFTGFIYVFLATLLISILNAVIFPLFTRFALPVTVFTLGIGGLIVNGIIVIFVSSVMKNFQIDDVASAILFIFGITFINTIVVSLLAIDDDDTYYRNIIKKQAQRKSKNINTKTPGVIFIQIDGLAYEVLRRAIQSGNVPNISRWIRDGKYRLERWETDWSSQTGASQAGILMGNNDNIPAFRWYDKELGRTLAFGKPADLKFLEEKLSNGKGLLFNNGASRGNLFSGNAEYVLLTVSSIGKKDSNGLGQGYFAYFSNPYNLPRSVILFVVDVIREVKSMIEQGRRDVWPRLTHHKLIYPFLRATMTVIQRDVLIQTLIGDIYEGRDTVYADLVGYDEVSHHTGPERHETLAVLRDIDKQLGRLEKVFADAPRPYHLVLVSDHGQTQGPTFKQITGYGLDEFVSGIIGGEVSSDMINQEDKNVLSTATLEITKTGGLVGKTLKKVQKVDQKTKERKNKPVENTDIKVLASGALGLIYFTKLKHRLTLEEINEKYPTLINELISDPLIGFILVNSEKDGGIVMSNEGKYFLKTDKIVGRNPLRFYGENALMHVKRSHGFKNVADIMVNSTYDPIMNEVHAFEELLGSHGALGGDQIFPFVLFPSSWSYPDKHIIGAANIHKLFKRWLGDLGQKV
jgi:uncharacterized membrane protein YvlD (DUF360 family)